MIVALRTGRIRIPEQAYAFVEGSGKGAAAL